MQIHLKQPEIESALKDYITKLGINLQNREVSINFTSGRQGKGLTADLDIPEIASDDLPDFPEDNSPVKASTSHLQVVENVPLAASEVPEEETPNEPDNSPSTSSSLFGG